MKAIIACDPNGGIGYKGKLPWEKLDGDLPRFKKLTMGKTVIMGRNTWDSLPIKPLSGRSSVIVTSRPLDLVYENVLTVPTLENFKTYEDDWLIGGASLLESSWNLVEEVHLTRTFAEYACDTFIDLIKFTERYWCEVTYTQSDHTYEIWRKVDEAILGLIE